MPISQFYKKKRAEVAAEIQRIAAERAQPNVRRALETEQFRLSVLNTADNDIAINEIINTTVQAVLDPTSAMLDVLRNRGFRPAEIRKVVHLIYNNNCRSLNVDSESLTYEDMLYPVAYFLSEHPEFYDTLNVDSLRNAK